LAGNERYMSADHAGSALMSSSNQPKPSEFSLSPPKVSAERKLSGGALSARPRSGCAQKMRKDNNGRKMASAKPSRPDMMAAGEKIPLQ
jgi:hypothetical protein